ncbi:hypothetical protein O0L34_g15886 [Tuta absoluta]|nr:hypothetical protein O0L34_g15886 [Tuta absoluta]
MAPREIGSQENTSESKTENNVSAPAIQQEQQTPLENMALYDSGDSSSREIEAEDATTSKSVIEVTVEAIVEENDMSDIVADIDFDYTVVEEDIELSVEGDGDRNSWQTKCESLSTRLKEVKLREKWADCELTGITEEPIKAHRAILAAASPVFDKLLDSDPYKSIIRLRNFDPEEFNMVLEYMYTDKISIPSCGMACRLYKTAHYFEMPQLKQIIQKYLLVNVDKNNAILVYEFAKDFDISEVFEKSLVLICENTVEILASQGFEAARIDTLETLFAINNLNIDSEIELVKAAKRWVQANAIDGITEDQEAKVKIRNAIKQIRFLAINPKEFAEYDMKSLLSDSDILAILLNNLSTKTCINLPHGFSTIRELRGYNTVYVAGI